MKKTYVAGSLMLVMALGYGSHDGRLRRRGQKA